MVSGIEPEGLTATGVLPLSDIVTPPFWAFTVHQVSWTVVPAATPDCETVRLQSTPPEVGATRAVLASGATRERTMPAKPERRL
jgi:hypothetical protein